MLLLKVFVDCKTVKLLDKQQLANIRTTKMDYKNDFHSDDDFDCSNGCSDSFSGTNSNGQGQMSNPHGLSKAELRKVQKYLNGQMLP